MPSLIFTIRFATILFVASLTIAHAQSDPPVQISTSPSILDFANIGDVVTFNITISEPSTNNGAFHAVTDGKYRISLPPNFEFVNNAGFNAKIFFKNASDEWEEYVDAISTPELPTDGSSTFHFLYDVPAQPSPDDEVVEQIVISNISVRAKTGAKHGLIYRAEAGEDGTMDGNPITTGTGGLTHGILALKLPVPVFDKNVIYTWYGSGSLCDWSELAFYETSGLGLGKYRFKWYNSVGDLVSYPDLLNDGRYSIKELGITSLTTPGVYEFWVTNSNVDNSGESDKTKITIHVENPQPVYLMASDPGPVCPNEPVTFIASPPPGGGYYSTYVFEKNSGPVSGNENIYVSTNHTSNFTVKVKANSNKYFLCSVEDEVSIEVRSVSTPEPDDAVSAEILPDRIIEDKDTIRYYDGEVVLSGKGIYSDGEFDGQYVFKNDKNQTIFYPYNASAGINVIQYVYENSDGCKVEVDFRIFVQRNNYNRVLEPEYCVNNDPDTLVVPDEFPGYEIYKVSVYRNGFVPADEIIQSGSYWIFTPSLAPQGDWVYYFEFTPAGQPYSLSTRRTWTDFVEMKSAVEVDFSGLDSSYCSDLGSPVQLFPTSSNGDFLFFKTTDSTSKTSLPANIFDIKSFTLDTGAYVMRYEITGGACASKRDRQFEIKRAPVVTFDIAPGVLPCVGTEIIIENKSDSLTNRFSYTWNFGDNFTSNDFEPIHVYSTGKEYQISLIVQDDSNKCKAQQSKNITIGTFPKTKFDFRGVCSDNLATEFINETDITGIEEDDVIWRWDFGDGYVLSGKGPGQITFEDKESLNNTTNGSYRVPTHKFQHEDTTYQVVLSVSGKEGCTHTDTKMISIFPTIRVADLSSYVEKFDSEKNGWISTSENLRGANSTWKITSPSGNVITAPASDPFCWITSNNNNTYNSEENSWVESPCFVLEGLERPMISLKTFSNTENGYDGTVLQYTTDGKTWKLVGDVDQGINWFNSNAISSGPGEQKNVSKGWTGTSRDSNWVSSKFSLDNVLTDAGSNAVRFRIAFASNDLNANGEHFDGFAFDDVYIGERKRVVVMEHFTNIKHPDARKEESIIDTYSNSGQGIKLQYHTSYPYVDEINQENKADPSARALLYGVSSVPRTVLDGTVTEDAPFSKDWGVVAYNRRTLTDAPFTIDVEFDTIGALNIHASIRKNESEAVLSNPFIVQIAVVQKELEVNGIIYKDVLRKLLPNAAGTRLLSDWTTGAVKIVSKSWTPSFQIRESDQYKVVVFIQDEKTKEIYQASQRDIPAVLLESIAYSQKGGSFNSLIDEITVYPNPASDLITVNPGTYLELEHVWQIIDYSGKVISEGIAPAGTNIIEIPTTSLPDGFYTLQFQRENHVVVREKISIIK